MKFDRRVLPRVYGPRDYLTWFLVGLAGLGLFYLAGRVLARPPQTPARAEATPAAPTLPTAYPTPSATPASGGTATPVPTAAPIEPPPTPVPTATWFYAIPANPTPAPTPVLPEAAPFPSGCDGPGRLNLLVIGLDGFSADNYRPARADTVILVGINFAQRSARLLSFPRDLWLKMSNLPQVGEARINSAYHYGELYAVPGGGPAQLAAALNENFGLRVDRHLVVNFLAFEQGVDAIGGIDIDIARPIHDGSYPLRDGSGTIAIDFPAGRVHLDGSAALIYARIRHDSSDFQRMRRQQQVLFAIRDRLLSVETLQALPGLAQVLYGAVRTDLSWEDIALLGCLGPQVSRDQIQTITIDSSMVQPTRFPDGAQVLLPDPAAIAPVLEVFNQGE